MVDDDFAPPIRLMNFVSEEQLDEARRSRGARVDDGTAQRDRSLYEILKENKDKKDAEFNERFKHRPPKALDEDESEFLDKLEMSRREYERQLADEEAQQLQKFHAAVAAESAVVHELKQAPPSPKVENKKLVGKRDSSTCSLGMIIKVKPQTKKARHESGNFKESLNVLKTANVETEKPDDSGEGSDVDVGKTLDLERNLVRNNVESHGLSAGGLVSYSDESEEDD